MTDSPSLDSRDDLDRPANDKPNDQHDASNGNSSGSSENGGKGSGQSGSSDYDGSTNPKIYPKSLATLKQADAAKERMQKRVEWIKARHSEIIRLCAEIQDTATKQELIAEDDRLMDEVKSLKKKRPLLDERFADLEKVAAAAIESHQFEDIDWN